MFPYWQGKEAVTLLQEGSLEPLPDCGHLPHVEQPQTFASIVGRFLGDRISGGGASGSGPIESGGGKGRERETRRRDRAANELTRKETVEVLHSNERPDLTSVFGTSTPPSGPSGSLRRLAFRYSESSYGHWLPLVLADRVSVVEGVVGDLKHGHVPNILAERVGRRNGNTTGHVSFGGFLSERF